MDTKETRYALERVQRAAKMLTPYYAEIYAAMITGDVRTVRRVATHLVNDAETIARDAELVAAAISK